MAFTEELDLFLSDFGVPASAGAVTGFGVLDMPSQVVADGMVLTTDYKLTVKTSVFGGLLYGDGITVDGVNYQVREAMKVDDGKFTELMLTKLAPEVVAPGSQPREFGLADLADVVLRDPQNGDRLVYKDGQWVDEEDADGTNVYNGGAAEDP
jgi:hypothetical protein